jgi:CubicO group peptidase (beta-lactamase class C family)
MKIRKFIVLLALSGLGSALSPRSSKLEACPLLGKQYLPPTSIASQAKFKTAIKTLDATLAGAVTKDALYKDTTFSIGMFSTSDDGLLWEYHHTGPSVANSSYGTNKVDADSIYRIGSISKLLTVYLFLLCEGDVRWSDPVSKHLPEILKDKANSWNAITPDWDAITIGDLAGQMGGLARDCKSPCFVEQSLH